MNIKVVGAIVLVLGITMIILGSSTGATFQVVAGCVLCVTGTIRLFMKDKPKE
jgi:hypothetical protein